MFYLIVLKLCHFPVSLEHYNVAVLAYKILLLISDFETMSSNQSVRHAGQCPVCYKVFAGLCRHLKKFHKIEDETAIQMTRLSLDKQHAILPYITSTRMDKIEMPRSGTYTIAQVVRLMNGIVCTVVGRYTAMIVADVPGGATSNNTTVVAAEVHDRPSVDTDNRRAVELSAINEITMEVMTPVVHKLPKGDATPASSSMKSVEPRPIRQCVARHLNFIGRKKPVNDKIDAMGDDEILTMRDYSNSTVVTSEIHDHSPMDSDSERDAGGSVVNQIAMEPLTPESGSMAPDEPRHTIKCVANAVTNEPENNDIDDINHAQQDHRPSVSESSNENRFRSDIYRGRTEVGRIRAMRKASGLYESIPWSEHAGKRSDHLNEFYMFLMRCKGKTNCAKNQANMISKLLYFVQDSEGQQTKTADPDAFLKYHSHVETYYDRLAGDLDGSGKGFGLQPSAMTNELRSVHKYFLFLEEIDNELDDDRRRLIENAEDAIKKRLDTNKARLHKLLTQKDTKWQMEGIDEVALQSAGAVDTNESVTARVASIVSRYGNDGAIATRNDSRSDHMFLTRYLMYTLTLRHGQRVGVAGGLTLGEFMILKQQVHQNENADLLLCIADHKFDAQQPVTVKIAKEQYELLLIYAERFRHPDALSNDKFFLRFESGSGRYLNISKEITAFQNEFGIVKKTATSVRRAVLTQAEGLGLTPLLQNSGVGFDNSNSIAKHFYKQLTTEKLKMAWEGSIFISNIISQKGLAENIDVGPSRPKRKCAGDDRVPIGTPQPTGEDASSEGQGLSLQSSGIGFDQPSSIAKQTAAKRKMAMEGNRIISDIICGIAEAPSPV